MLRRKSEEGFIVGGMAAWRYEILAVLIQEWSHTLHAERPLVRNMGLSCIVEAFEHGAEECEFHSVMSGEALQGF